MKKLFILSFIITLSFITSKVIFAQDTTSLRDMESSSRGQMMEDSQIVRPLPPLPADHTGDNQTIKEIPQIQTDKIKIETTESVNISKDFSTDSTKFISMIDKSTSYKYIPVGKPDPFRPIFRKRTDSQKDNKALTPLQRFDLGQLELTTIITGKFGYKALVMDPTGKGYIVTSGTLIGNNNGKVSDISGIRLIVDEQLHDRFGNVKNSRRYLEMKGDKK